MSRLIRLTEGEIAANTLLSTSSYLVTNWARTADMGAADSWLAVQPEQGLVREQVQSLEVGAGGYYGRYSGVLEFFQLTTQMRDYIEDTILNGRGIGKISAFLHTPKSPFEMDVFWGQMISPFRTGNTDYFRYSDGRYWNVQYVINRAVEQTVTVFGFSATEIFSLSDNDEFLEV